MKKIFLFLGLTITIAALLTYCTSNLDEKEGDAPALRNGQPDNLTGNCIDSSLIDSSLICTQVYRPVCGCDGKTYANPCEAKWAGVRFFTEGPCPSDTTRCLGKPDTSLVCTLEYNPVCGCDGKTYANPCLAKKAGVLSYKQGPCNNNPAPCKGKPNPQILCPDVYKPVCGCDGKTYSNACYARKAGILRYTEGPCGGNQ